MLPWIEPCYDVAYVKHFITKTVTEFCERRFGVTDACGNKVAEPEVLKRWFFNLNTYTKEKEQIIDKFIKDLKNDKCSWE